MVPTTKQKIERKYVPPTFIDEESVKKLSPEKQQYWANRIRGLPGQGPKPKKPGVTLSSDVTTYFDNEGNMVTKNRAARRQRPTTPPYYTKSNHAQKKLRGQIK